MTTRQSTTVRPPLGLLSRGRGLIELDQAPEQLDELLRRARIPVGEDSRNALHAIVLGTPGLDRIVSGVLLHPAALPAASALLRDRGVVIGVRMGDSAGSRYDAVRIGREIDDHLSAGARLARRRVVLDQVAGPAPVQATARWAAACQRAGLVPLVDLVVPVPAGAGLEDAEKVQSAAIGAAAELLDAAGVDLAEAFLLADLVLPGRRSSQVATAEDVARATARCLHAARVGKSAGVAFRPTGRPAHLTAHLAAMQWMNTGWPLGFCLGRSVLESVALTWRGRPDRVVAAQQELRALLTPAVAVLRIGLNEVDRRGGVGWW